MRIDLLAMTRDEGVWRMLGGVELQEYRDGLLSQDNVEGVEGSEDLF